MKGCLSRCCFTEWPDPVFSGMSSWLTCILLCMMGDSHLPLDWFKIHLAIDLPFSISVSFQRGWTEGSRPFLVFEAQSFELRSCFECKGEEGTKPTGQQCSFSAPWSVKGEEAAAAAFSLAHHLDLPTMMGYTFKLCAKMGPSPPGYPCRVLGYGERSNIEFFKWLVRRVQRQQTPKI